MKTVLFGFVIVVAAASVATADAPSDPSGVSTTLQGNSRGCLTQAGLRGRIAHYLSNTARASGLEIHVRAPNSGSTEFALARDGSSIAVRRFRSLPKACADRLDAIAFAIAVAVEHAGLAPAGATPESATSRPETTTPAPASQLATNGAPDAADDYDAARVAAVATPVAVTPVIHANVSPKPELAPVQSKAASEAARSDTARSRATQNLALSRQLTSAPSAPVATTPRARVNRAHDTREEVIAAVARPPSAFQLSLHAGANVLFEVLPVAVVAGVVGGELAFGHDVSARISGLATMQTQSKIAGGQAFAQLVGGEGAVCRRTQFDWLMLNGCLGMVAGQLAARGEDYDSNQTANLFWLGAVARLGLRLFARGPVALEVGAEGYTNLIRPILHIVGTRDESVATPTFSGSSGLEMIFTP